MTEDPQPAASTRPTVAFLVAAYNSAASLPACLEGVFRQRPDRVVVVNDGSTDATRKLSESWPRVEWIHLPSNQGVAAARNAGLEAIGDCEFIAVVDSDIELHAGWLDGLLVGVDWESYSIACGRIHAADAGLHWAATLDERAMAAKFPDQDREITSPWRDVMYFNYLFKREVFETVGRFDPVFRTNAEDSDLFYRCARAGFRFRYVHSAKGLHRYPPPDLLTHLKRQFRNGEYTIQFHLKQGTPLVPFKTLKALLFLVLAWRAPMVVFGALTSPFDALFNVGGLFLVAGLLWGIRLEFRPVYGGWIKVLAWMAKGFGELKGAFAHYLRVGLPIGG